MDRSPSAEMLLLKLYHNYRSTAVDILSKLRQAEENFSAADLPPLSEETMAQVRAVYDRTIREQVHHIW